MKRVRVDFLVVGAGLVEGCSGAGIEQAVLSAHRLAKSLLNGVSYKEAMAPQTEYVAKLAQTSKKRHFMHRILIIRAGKPV